MSRVKENIVFRLNPDKKNALDKAASEIGMNRSELLQTIIDDYLDNALFDKFDYLFILALIMEKDDKINQYLTTGDNDFFHKKMQKESVRIQDLKIKLKKVVYG